MRSQDQSDITQFWAGQAGTYTPLGHWNRIAQTIAESQGDGFAKPTFLAELREYWRENLALNLFSDQDAWFWHLLMYAQRMIPIAGVLRPIPGVRWAPSAHLQRRSQ